MREQEESGQSGFRTARKTQISVVKRSVRVQEVLPGPQKTHMIGPNTFRDSYGPSKPFFSVHSPIFDLASMWHAQ